LPGYLAEQLEHARNFSETIHGAALLYNLMLAEKAKADGKDLVKEYRRELRNWSSMLSTRPTALKKWDRQRFWFIALDAGSRLLPPNRVPTGTRRFIEQWLDIALVRSRRANIQSDQVARKLILRRELECKPGQARLQDAGAFKKWNGAAGTGRMDFRWAQAGRILSDIVQGMKRRSHAST